MPLSNRRADAARDALLQEPRSAQEKSAAQAAFQANYYAPGKWVALAALLGAAITGGIGYLGSGSSHPWWIHGASLGVGITQIVWRRRHKA